MAHPHKSLYSSENLAEIFYASQAIANFVLNNWLEENAIGSIRWPILGNPSIGAKISQISLMQVEL